jgi:hypothetical protein
MIKNQKQLTKILGGMQGIVTLDAWRPYLQDAAELHIKPAIGPVFYNYLDGLVNTNDYGNDIEATATAAEKELLGYLRTALVNYADLYSSNRLGMANSDAGKADPNGQHTSSSPKWKTMAALELVRDKADDYLEKALSLLAEQPEAFEDYKDSPFFQLYADMLIYSAARLTEFIPAANGSHTFYKTIKAQLTIQQRVVGGMLGAAFYNDLKAQNQKILKGEAVSDQYRTALDMVCRLIASRALVTALPWMNISEDFRTKTRIGGLEDKTILSDARRSELKLQESLSADAAKFALFNYLNNSATDLVFPAYFNSTYYTAPQTDKPISRLANDPNNKYAFI